MAQELRNLHIRLNAGLQTRTEKFEGIDYTVVPVVALVEGVIQALNAPHPEFVSASRFSVAPSGWNGRPVFINHPMQDGSPVSGNTPEVLKTAIGKIFNARISGKKLLMEAWIDPAKGKSVISRLASKSPVEISTGAFILLSDEKGTHNGKPYDGAWDTIIPDHLAILEEGFTGACSATMGCGIRAAMYEVTEDRIFEVLGGPGSGWTAEGGHVPKGNNAATHNAAAKAHTDAMVAHSNAANLTGTDKSSQEFLNRAVKDATSKAEKATKATNTKPYASDAARTYGKMAEKATDPKQKALYHEMAAKYHEAAAFGHTQYASSMRHSTKGALMSLREKVKELIASTKLRDAAGGDDAEDTAEMIAYQTMETMLRQAEESLNEARMHVGELLTAEEGEDPAAEDEAAESEIECARLDAVVATSMSVIDVMYRISSMARDLIREEENEDIQKVQIVSTSPYAMRSAKGARNSKGDMKVIQSVHDHSVSLGADCAPMKGAQQTPCGCNSRASQGENMAKTRTERITALLANEHNPYKTKEALDASSDANLEALEAHCENAAKLETALGKKEEKKVEQRVAVETPKAKTREEWLAEAPESLRTLVQDVEASNAARKTILVAKLKTAQTAFSEAELTTMDVKQLDKLAVLAKLDTPAVDFTGMGAPRVAEEKKDDYMSQPPPDGYRIAIDGTKGGGKEKVN